MLGREFLRTIRGRPSRRRIPVPTQDAGDDPGGEVVAVLTLPLDSPEEQDWAPVVVGKPTAEFESKPPSPALDYRPDTIFDGWSTEAFTVRLASVRGYSHRYYGTPRQDDVIAAFHGGMRAVLFAVADGLSSATHSHIGATVACRAAIEVMHQQFDTAKDIDLAAAARAAAAQLTSRAARLAGEGETAELAAERLFGTTLIVGYVAPGSESAAGAMVTVGDSGAWILDRAHYEAVLAEKSDPRAAFVSSAVSPLPRIPRELAPVAFRLPPGAALLVGTDGFGDPLDGGDGPVGRLFADRLRIPPASIAFAHLLDFSRRTFDDDRTLLAVWANPDDPGTPR